MSDTELMLQPPPPPPVDYSPPENRVDPWRPWWLKLLLKLRVGRARAIDERRHAKYVEDTRYLVDE
jgi:hypothetical protein